MNNQNSDDKYAVAWTKLTDCIQRKQKERSLALYRLLSHSITDEALAVQLEGDILLAFDDVVPAVAKYKVCVDIYQNTDRFGPAIGVCEHICTLKSNDIWTLNQLCNLYEKIGLQKKAAMAKQQLEKISTGSV